ncbi:hypothetical protein C5167_020343 [Papaver somniferum]|uniref:GOLD domain-containing protein n=1 Tax=Papaver somniferum TaxID=3469 RepID=A0A4Y7IW06_PAPSO|nr:hypothetical protein C5167_020343 [Papaver somniferum]
MTQAWDDGKTNRSFGDINVRDGFLIEVLIFKMELIAGGVAGAFAKTIVSPLECIKILLQMEHLSSKFIPFALLAILSIIQVAVGIRFVIDREECFSHLVPCEGDTVHVSFVMIKAGGWHYGEDGVDLVVKGPTEEQIHDARDKTSEKFEFVAHKKGVHKFCFTNKSPYHETLDFDIHVGHFT